VEVEVSSGVRAGRAGLHNNSLARAAGSSVAWARPRRRRILERARALARVHKICRLRCLAPSQVQHQARTPARVPLVEAAIPELNQLAVASSAAPATLPRARVPSKIRPPAGAFSAAVAGRRHKLNCRPGAAVASSAIQRQTNLNRRVEVAAVAGAFLAAAAMQQRTSRRQVVVSLGGAAERRRPRVNHNRQVVDCLGTLRPRPGRRVAQGPNLQRRVAYLVLVPPPVRVRVRERLGRGRQVFSADNNRNNRRRRVGYSETRGAPLPHHSQAVYSGVGQRSSNLRPAVDCSPVLREQLNSSNLHLRQAVDFLGVPLLNNNPLRAVGYLGVPLLNNNPLRAVGYLGALQPNSNLLQAADCLGVPPHNNRLQAADYLEVLQVNNNNNNPLRVADYLEVLQLNNNHPLRVVGCLGVLLPNSSLLRVVDCLETRPHSSQPQAVVGASLLPLQHSQPNSLDRALFSVRQQRRAQVYLGALAQEH
jgi:hypothetical protein